MTLEEAIKHAEEVAEEKEKDRDVRKLHLDNRNSHNNIVHYQKACKCSEEHRQLAEWLKDYKRLLEQEPCEDAISRQAVLDCLTATGLKKYDFILNARDKIKNLPSVKPQEPFNIDTYCKEHFMVMVDKDVWEKSEKALKQEPKTGHWINIDDIKSECSECGHREPNERFIFEDINFCAKCGARMES